ncbi:MAG: TonB-dependent receptor [Bacteroidetes bacterium]|nr:TonB-dependent receptor [Bacteroidota bacterium]
MLFKAIARCCLAQSGSLTKTLLRMKFTALLILVACLQVSARSYSQKITLTLRNAPLEKAFKAIERQSGYHFWYDYSLLQSVARVTVDTRNASLAEALDLCLKGQPLSYSIVNNTIIIDRKALPPPPPDPRIEVRGRVLDSAGHPLAGVSITVKGHSGGSTTDGQGNFRILVAPSATLRFSYIGYVAVELPVEGRASLDVRLTARNAALNDAIVIGYGTQRRSNITSAVSTVSSKSIENQPLTSLDQAIAGQAAGVQVSQVTGTPGGGVTIRVRGTGSISAGNEPLYVIDGFPIEGSYGRDMNPLSTLNPNDIESIQILKDAAAAAIYGSRGSNGVVIVTTKHGKPGKARVQLDSYYGLQQVAHKIPMLDASQYAAYNTEARNNGWVGAGGKASDPNAVRPVNFQIPPVFANPSALGKGTDWQDAVFQTAPMQSYQLSVSGGNENTQYLVSGGYFKQEGVVIHTGFQRYALRFNLDSRLSDKIKIGLNLAPSYSRNDVLPVEDQVFGGGILGSALAMPPTTPVYNPDGSFTTQLGSPPYNLGVIDNPVAIASKIKGGSSTYRTLGNLFAEYEIVKDLRLRSSVGADYLEGRTSTYWPSTLGRSGVLPPVSPTASAASSTTFNWLNENTLTFDKTIHEDHQVTALAGFTSQHARTDNMTLTAINFPNDLVTTLNAGQVSTGGTTIDQWSLLSFLGRVTYGYRSKYLLTATIRRDGSSRFGQENKWGTFPSASVGWNVAREDFMRGAGFISDLKLRGSYGLAGNNTIGNYSYIGLLSSSRYVFGPGTGSVVNGLQPATLSNQYLGWEKMRQADVGLDAGFFQGRIYLTVDYYDKVTSDLLLNVPVPATTGYTNALQNIGKVSNRGWEFTLSTKNTTGVFKWSTDLNISFDRNKVLALGPNGDPIISTSPSFSPQTHITEIGHPLGSFYGYRQIGVYRDQNDVAKSPVVAGATGSHPGDLKFQDTNHDGVISPADETIIGSNHPSYTFGVSNNFSYQRFTLSVLIDGAQGVSVLNGARRNIGLVTESYSRKDVLGRWQSPDQPGDGHTPRANIAPTGGNVSYVSSLLIENASFLRFRNINLRYAFSPAMFARTPVKSLAVYFAVQNPFTITPYQGYNPEQNLNGASPLTPGVDFNGYPVARVYTLGLNLTLQ